MAESAPQLTPETLVGYTSVNSIAREGQKSNIRDKNRLDLTEEQKRQDDEIVWNFIGKPEQGGNEQIIERQRIVRHSLPTMPHCGKRIPFLMGMRLSRTHGFSIGYSAFAAKGLGIVSGGGQKATFSAR